MRATARNGATALRDVARCESCAPVEALLGAGADVGATSNDGNTALRIASNTANATVVRSLSIAGVDVDAQTKDSATGLCGAGKLRQPAAAVVRALVQAGANVLAVDKHGVSALHEAAQSVAAVRVLLRAGADVGASTKTGETPLHRAASMSGDVLRVPVCS